MCKKCVIYVLDKIEKVKFNTLNLKNYSYDVVNAKKNPLLQDGIKDHDFTEGVG